jgi:probable rRNA maturation factor
LPKGRFNIGTGTLGNGALRWFGLFGKMNMKINVEVNSLVKPLVAIGFIKRVATAVICGELNDKPTEVSIVLVSPQKIRTINKKYRKVDVATDVLSFAHDDILGELAICPQVVKKDAKQAGVSVEREMAWVVIHGILHLLGYDHEAGEKEAVLMREKEQVYLLKLKLL